MHSAFGDVTFIKYMEMEKHMKFSKYIGDKIFEIVFGVSFAIMMALILSVFQTNYFMIVLLELLFFICMLAILLWDFFRRKMFYRELVENTERLDKKYLVTETLKKPDFYEGELIFHALYDINKSMYETVNQYRISIDAFKDYIEMWIHEVKVPLASLLLMCHNNEDLLDKKIMGQVRRIDQYMEQILYYVRSEHAENDYLIKEVKLSKVITQVALNNREDLLENNIDFSAENITYSVLTDGKWLEFILNQIINNSIKYKSEKRQPCIQIFAQTKEENIILSVRDNGIGISPNDLPNVYKKSFTGTNGRTHTKSTGMGLYIVKQLCKKLGHRVEIESVQGEYTQVSIYFAQNEFYKMFQ